MTLAAVFAHAWHGASALLQNTPPPQAGPPETNAWTNPATSEAVMAVHESIRALAWTLPFILLAEFLLLYVIFKFRDRGDGRKPATFHENNVLEFAWTVIPAIVVLIVALHSFPTLRFMEYGGSNPALNVQVVGHQFFWEYKYPQYSIDISNSALVVPADQVVDLDLTSVDVIHGWYVPALGIQEDALPGRVTDLWFNAKPGHYKGQCTQLCGVNHGQMLIDVEALPPAEFAAWVRQHGSNSGAQPTTPQGPAGGSKPVPASGAAGGITLAPAPVSAHRLADKKEATK